MNLHQKNAYYAQVEALNLTKKDNETVRHFALKVQLVEKAGVMRMHLLSTLNAMKSLQKDFQKPLKTLQTKDKVKTHLHCLRTFNSFSYFGKTC